MKYLLILILSLVSVSAPAAEIKKSRAKNSLKRSFFQATGGYQIWHEDILATSAGTEGSIPMQFHGFQIGGSYVSPLKNFRWVQYYGLDFLIGSAKGMGRGPVTDALKDQPWMGVTAKPGIIYRATAVSEVGLFLPIAFRSVSWELDETAQLELKDESFSVGLGAQFINKFTPRSALVASITHQHIWQSTVWGIAWQYDWK